MNDDSRVHAYEFTYAAEDHYAADNWLKPPAGKGDWLAPAPAVAHAPVVRQVEAELKALMQLPADWDDNGAGPIDRKTVESALALLSELRIMCRNRSASMPKPEVSACANGSIDFYWKLGSTRTLLNVTPDSAAEFSGKTDDGLRTTGTRRHIAALADWLTR